MLRPQRHLAFRVARIWPGTATPAGRRCVMAFNSSKAPRILVLWILFCAFANCAGWGLSAIHLLNAAGYCVALLVGVALIFAFRPRLFAAPDPARIWHKARRRFRRPVPLAFLVLVMLGLAGGMSYAPNNYDALAYRVPRVLHWLAEGRWHWIHTEFQRLNARGCGFEWVAAPLIALARTDRFLFLLNFASFCFLPGLLFSTLRRLGVAARPAWGWMWILPTGYCFLLQACSLGNDLFGATFVLAAVSFALRARQTRSIDDLWLSLLAAGLSSAVKANNLPLLLVWALVVAPCWKLPLGNAVATVAVGAMALGASFLPTALMNVRYSGDWTGARAEQIPLSPPNLWARPLGNLGRLVMDSFLPPINPFNKLWNEHVAGKLVPRPLERGFAEAFHPDGPLLAAQELETEEGAGLGLGVCVLLVLSLVAALRAARKDHNKKFNRIAPATALVVGASFIAFATFLQASFVRSTPRLAMAYYPFLALPLLLHPGQADAVRKLWWSASALAVCGLAALVMILSPARPLFPAKPILAAFRRLGCSDALLVRADKVYTVYSERADAFAPAIRFLPPEANVIGLITFDDPEASLWRPFGSRRVVHVCPGDTSERLLAQGLHLIWVNPERYARFFQMPFDEWLRQMNAEVVQTLPLTLRAGDKTVSWQLVRLR